LVAAAQVAILELQRGEGMVLIPFSTLLRQPVVVAAGLELAVQTAGQAEALAAGLAIQQRVERELLVKVTTAALTIRWLIQTRVLAVGAAQVRLAAAPHQTVALGRRLHLADQVLPMAAVVAGRIEIPEVLPVLVGRAVAGMAVFTMFQLMQLRELQILVAEVVVVDQQQTAAQAVQA